MKNLKRAERKREMKRFKVGDVVTWGNGALSHRVVEVNQRGVVIDVSSCTDANLWAAKQPDDRFFLLVLFDGNTQCNSMRCRFREYAVTQGPVRHSDDAPDKVQPRILSR